VNFTAAVDRLVPNDGAEFPCKDRLRSCTNAFGETIASIRRRGSGAPHVFRTGPARGMVDRGIQGPGSPTTARRERSLPGMGRGATFDLCSIADVVA
jgi:hypothetical protein